MVQLTLFPEDLVPPAEVLNSVLPRLDQMTLEHPRQWRACWLFMELWKLVELDSFWIPRLLKSRKGTYWLSVGTPPIHPAREKRRRTFDIPTRYAPSHTAFTTTGEPAVTQNHILERMKGANTPCPKSKM